MADVRASGTLRLGLFALVSEPEDPQTRRRIHSLPVTAALALSAIAAAAVLTTTVIGIVGDTRAPTAASPNAPLPNPSPTIAEPTESPAAAGIPAVAGMIGAPCDDAGSHHLGPLTDSADVRVVAVCWPIETGLGTVWATGGFDPGTPGGARALATLDRITERDCGARLTGTDLSVEDSPVRPVMLHRYAVRYGCLPSGDDPGAAEDFRQVVVAATWTLGSATATCDPRVSAGQLYRPYARIADEDWDFGIACVDAPGTGRSTAFLVVTGERLAVVKSLVDRWPRLGGTAFCQDTAPRGPRVALWLSRTGSLGQMTGVFGPRSCALDQDLVKAFRLITDPRNQEMALPDLTGLDLPQVVTTLTGAGYLAE